MSAMQSTRILCIPPYYESHFELTVKRLQSNYKHLECQFFTIDRRYVATNDLDLLLFMSRTIVREERIQMLIADTRTGQLIVAKLCQEFPRLRSGGMSFLSTLQCLDRALMIDTFGVDQCIPTLSIEAADDWSEDLHDIRTFFSDKTVPGYAKSLFGFDGQSTGFRFETCETLVKAAQPFVELCKEQHRTSLQSIFRIYVPRHRFPSAFKPSFLLQPFLDLTSDPRWRLVIASACIFDKEISVWPLVDGYSGWPFLAEQPLAIMPIIVCPSRQLTVEQQAIVYARFRQHLNRLISDHHLRYGWIECSYFISRTNEVCLISMKPTFSVYLSEAFKWTCEHGDPLFALVQLSNRQRPPTPILNGKTVYAHRLWARVTEKCTINEVVNIPEAKRIERSTACMTCFVRLRFRNDESIVVDEKHTCSDLGFLQVSGDYHEQGLARLIEARSSLLKHPELVPFCHASMLSTDPYQFDPVTCLPSDRLLRRLSEVRRHERKDLV